MLSETIWTGSTSSSSERETDLRRFRPAIVGSANELYIVGFLDDHGPVKTTLRFDLCLTHTSIEPFLSACSIGSKVVLFLA